MADELGFMEGVAFPETVTNSDIQGLIDRIDNFMQETAACASATRHETSIHDLKRCKAMVAHFKDRFEHFAGEPELDAPHSHPRPFQLAAAKPVRRIQNSDLQDVNNALATIRVELAFCDSAERASGFKEADAERIRAFITKLEQLGDVIEAASELDMPDVDPQEP